MRLCRFQTGNSVQLGMIRDDDLISIHAIDPELPDTMQRLLCVDNLESRLADATIVNVVSTEYRLLAPISAPDKVICIGLNYRDHAIETNSPIPDQPIVFCKFPSTLIGPNDPIILPAISNAVDYEAELVVVIGRKAYDVTVENAMDHVFGYTCGHDVSARDWQKGTPGGQWLLGKAFDTFAPIGPAIVPKSQVPDPGKLGVKMDVSGEILQDGTTSEMIFGVSELVSYLSKVFTLYPGDLIFTGTPPGVGAARKPQRFLAPGDVCTVEIDGLGKLSNPCVSADSSEANRFRNSRS